MADYIAQRQPLGGLLFLLPQMFSFENKDDMRSNHQNQGNDLLKNVVAELERLLIHANVPVSVTFIISFVLSLCTTSLMQLFIIFTSLIYWFMMPIYFKFDLCSVLFY